MANILTRAEKGAPLTHDEVDANFVNLNNELGMGPTFQPQGGATLTSARYDNYTETDILSKGLLVFRANGDPSYLTGIDGAGRERGSLLMIDLRSDGTGALMLVNESPDSAPGNQFRLPNFLDYYMASGQLVLVYTVGNGFGAWSGWVPLFAQPSGLTLNNVAFIQPEPPGTVPYDLAVPPGTALAQMITEYGDATVEGIDSDGMAADEGTVLVFTQQWDTYFTSFIHESVLCLPQNQISFRNGRTRTLRFGESLALVYTNGRWRELAPWPSWGDIGGTISDQADLNTVLTGLQPFNENLEGLASVSGDDQTIPYFDIGQPQGMNVTGFTAAGRALLDDVDAAAQRATLGLGSMAVENSGDFDPAGSAAAAQAAAQSYADAGDAATLASAASDATTKANAAQAASLPLHATADAAAVLATGRNIDGQAFNGSTDITVIAPGTHGATSKATPVDADELPIVDSAAANVLKKLTWANLKATLKTYFDGLYRPLNRRVASTASSTTPTPNADTTDLYDLTALAGNATFGAPTGTPVDGQQLVIRIKDDGSARTLAWNAAYVAHGVALPTTTVASKILRVGFEYDTANGLNKWCCIASSQEA